MRKRDREREKKEIEEAIIHINEQMRNSFEIMQMSQIIKFPMGLNNFCIESRRRFDMCFYEWKCIRACVCVYWNGFEEKEQKIFMKHSLNKAYCLFGLVFKFDSEIGNYSIQFFFIIPKSIQHKWIRYVREIKSVNDRLIES